MIVASAIDSPSCGMRMGTRAIGLHFQQTPHRRSYRARGWTMRRPQIGMIRHRSIPRTEPLRRSVEQAKTVGGDAGDHLGRHAAPRPSFSDTQHAPGSGHRSQAPYQYPAA